MMVMREIKDTLRSIAKVGLKSRVSLCMIIGLYLG